MFLYVTALVAYWCTEASAALLLSLIHGFKYGEVWAAERDYQQQNIHHMINTSNITILFESKVHVQCDTRRMSNFGFFTFWTISLRPFIVWL